MLASIIDRVFHLKVRGKIDHQMLERVHTSLDRIWFHKPQVIAVSICSEGGSLVQAKTLAATLQNLGRRTGAPVFTFAEDYVFGSALVLLTSGNKSYVSKYTVIGDIGYTHSSFGLKQFAEHWDYERKYIYSGQNKVRLNQYEDLKQQDQEWMQSILKKREDQLKTEILRNRMDQFVERNDKVTNLEENLFNKTVVAADLAVELGLVDDIQELDHVLHERYHGVKVVDILQKGLLQQLSIQKFNSLSVPLFKQTL